MNVPRLSPILVPKITTGAVKMASYEQRGSSTRAVVRLPGGGKKTKTFDTKREAQAWAEGMEKKKLIGTLTSSKSITVGDLFEAYMPIAEKEDGGRWNKLRIMKWLEDRILCKKPLPEVITHDIDEWIVRRLDIPNEQTGEPISGSTVNRELNLMSGAFAYAIKTRKWIKENPCHGANRPEDNPSRRNKPLLTADQIKEIRITTGVDADPKLETITARVGATFLLALETGMRSGEILRLRPEDYQKKKRTVHVRAIEKGGRKGARSGRNTTTAARNVPLTARAIELLDLLLKTMPADQKPRPELGFSYPPYIVGLNDRQRDANWRKARDKTSIENLHYHDTKHEAATRLSKFLDVLALSHAIGTKDLRLLRDTYYNDDAEQAASLLPERLAIHA
nr:tyrosine-type recombinase/integrase [Pusillimonas noertemannii]